MAVTCFCVFISKHLSTTLDICRFPNLLLMTAEQLKTETKSIHAKTEKLLISRLKAAGTLADYASILQSFYGFIVPLEQKLNTSINPELLPDYHNRRKAELLGADLAALGVPPSARMEAAQPSDLPRLDHHAQAMGALYVFEGSTLGGQAILNMIQSRIRVPRAACTFFAGYGSRTMPMWKTFVQRLNDDAHQPSAPAIIEAAADTFSSFYSWLQKTLVHAAVEDER